MSLEDEVLKIGKKLEKMISSNTAVSIVYPPLLSFRYTADKCASFVYNPLLSFRGRYVRQGPFDFYEGYLDKATRRPKSGWKVRSEKNA